MVSNIKSNSNIELGGDLAQGFGAPVELFNTGVTDIKDEQQKIQKITQVRLATEKTVLQVGDGSGVAIGTDQSGNVLVLTNAHVSGKDKTMAVTLPSGEIVHGDVLHSSQRGLGNPDLAIIAIPRQALAENEIEIASLASNPPTPGTDVYHVGFPGDARKGVAATITEGQILRLLPEEGSIAGEVDLLSDGRIRQGMSGGGIFSRDPNGNYRLVGLNQGTAAAIIPPKVEGSGSYAEVTEGAKSRGISIEEIQQYLDLVEAETGTTINTKY